MASTSISVKSPCWISIRSPAFIRGQKSYSQLRNALFVEAQNHVAACKNHGTPDQIRLLRHKTNRLRTRRWLLLHLRFAIQLVSRIEELLVILVADQIFDFRRAQFFFSEIAEIKLKAALFHKLLRLAARRAVWLMQKLRLLRFPPPGRCGSACLCRAHPQSSVVRSLSCGLPFERSWYREIV